MGQAASYAESSVQRALLKLKMEEIAEEDVLLKACGYARHVAPPSPPPPTTIASLSGASSPPPIAPSPSRGEAPAEMAVPVDIHKTTVAPDSCSPVPAPAASSSPTSSAALPPPPESFGPLITATPEHYSLDELRQALLHLPDALWLSLHRVSLLFMLDFNHDGLISVSDINRFVDWGIKTVGREVPSEEVGDLLQAQAALYCWYLCLQEGDEWERQRMARSQLAGSYHTRRRQKQKQHRPRQDFSRSIQGLLLMDLRDRFLYRQHQEQQQEHRDGSAAAEAEEKRAIAPGCSTGETYSGTPSPTTTISGASSPLWKATGHITEATRLSAASFFADWMLRLLDTQERERRHDRFSLQRRLRYTTVSDILLRSSNRLRHSQQLLQSSRLRASSGPIPPQATTASSTSAAIHIPHQGRYDDVDGDDDADTVLLSLPHLSGSREPEVAEETKREKERAELTTTTTTTARPSLRPPSQSPIVESSNSSASASTAKPSTSTASFAGRACGSPTALTRPGKERLNHHLAMRSGETSPARPHCIAIRRPRVARVEPSPSPAPLSRAEPPQTLSPLLQSDSGILPSGFDGASSSAMAVMMQLPPSLASPTSPGFHEESMTNTATTEEGSDAALLPSALMSDMMASLLLEVEQFYEAVERNDWCTIGAVEEIYIDVAVQDTYGLSFWSFCRLLNDTSANEVEAALDLTTEQAIRLFLSAAAVEEYREGAAARQLQRTPLLFTCAGTISTQHLRTVPIFIVSRTTLQAFLTTFIHGYWEMLETMGFDPIAAHRRAAVAAEASTNRR